MAIYLYGLGPRSPLGGAKRQRLQRRPYGHRPSNARGSFHPHMIESAECFCQPVPFQLHSGRPDKLEKGT